MSKKREKQHKKSHSRSKIERNKQDITCEEENKRVQRKRKGGKNGQRDLTQMAQK